MNSLQVSSPRFSSIVYHPAEPGLGIPATVRLIVDSNPDNYGSIQNSGGSISPWPGDGVASSDAIKTLTENVRETFVKAKAEGREAYEKACQAYRVAMDQYLAAQNSVIPKSLRGMLGRPEPVEPVRPEYKDYLEFIQAALHRHFDGEHADRLKAQIIEGLKQIKIPKWMMEHNPGATEAELTERAMASTIQPAIDVLQNNAKPFGLRENLNPITRDYPPCMITIAKDA